jgi:hypothetical protein
MDGLGHIPYRQKKAGVHNLSSIVVSLLLHAGPLHMLSYLYLTYPSNKTLVYRTGSIVSKVCSSKSHSTDQNETSASRSFYRVRHDGSHKDLPLILLTPANIDFVHLCSICCSRFQSWSSTTTHGVLLLQR